VRENRTPGTVRGLSGNWQSYLDSNPLHELENPECAQRQFNNLYRNGSCEPPKNYPILSGYGLREEIPINKLIWVDKILDSQTSETIVGLKNVTSTEDYFNDHFPLKPVLPGVLIIESLVSLSKRLIERTLALNNLADKKPIVKTIQSTKFRKFVQPGDQLIMDATLETFTASESTLKVKATVDNKAVATLSATFVHLDKAQYKKNVSCLTGWLPAGLKYSFPQKHLTLHTNKCFHNGKSVNKFLHCNFDHYDRIESF
jgi:3-hydroxyacyl-[acyl-carrier-protein] dehydratase